MESGKIVHFEDSVTFAETIGEGIGIFSDGRHEVVAQAANLSGSLAVLDQIASGELEANVVLTDGNLSPAVGGADAVVIIGRVKELGLNVRTILMSSQSAGEIGIEVDAEVPKSGSVLPAIVDAIDDFSEVG